MVQFRKPGVPGSFSGGVERPSLSEGLKKVGEFTATDTRESLARSMGADTESRGTFVKLVSQTKIHRDLGFRQY